MRAGYTKADFRADALAGLVVGVVALPLSMALAIASGAPPQHGLYTAIVAGVIAPLLGGSRLQITGPTAAFVVLLVPVVAKFGLAGLLVAGLMAGAIQLAMGLARLGRLIEFIPHPVTTGFTSGIALVIAVIQLKDAFGLHVAGSPESFVERVELYWHARGSASGWEALIAALTLALLLLVPRVIKRVPAPLIALTVASVLVVILEHTVGGFGVATIGSRFQTVVDGAVVNGIPPVPPTPVWPWEIAGGAGLSFELVRELLPAAFAIAMLGAIESLLSAVVADGVTGDRHNPDAELVALGVANLACPFFGGIPATGALARTATNIRAGGQSPLASVIHSVFVLACTVALAPLVSYLPMAAMAALLLIVAKNMSEARHFVRLVRIAPRSDVFVLVTCFALTVAFDMVVAVSVGVVLAALLFMRRMSELTHVRLETAASHEVEVPAGVRHYEVAGPLFFGAAQRAFGVLAATDAASVVIVSMTHVPTVDATGLVALESLVAKLARQRRKLILVGLQPAVTELLARAGIKRDPGKLAFAPDLDTALSMAILHDARPREMTAATAS